MSAMNDYTVEETRRVRVWANSPGEALQIANSAFNIGTDNNGFLHEKVSGVEGNTQGAVTIDSVTVTRD